MNDGHYLAGGLEEADQSRLTQIDFPIDQERARQAATKLQTRPYAMPPTKSSTRAALATMMILVAENIRSTQGFTSGG